MDKQELLKRFQLPDDKLLFSKVLDRLFLCQSKHEKTFSAFLDPFHAEKIKEAIESEADEAMQAYGGAPGCERVMLGFAPSYEALEPGDFPIDCVGIAFMPKFGSKLSHRDFLGALIGLGVNREKMGDIHLREGKAEAYVHRDVSGFVCANLEQVGRVKATATVEAPETAYWAGWEGMAPDDGREMAISVSSMRLDAIVSAVFRLSRSASAQLASSGKVSVNWTPALQSSRAVGQGDTITVRGYGRVRVEEIGRGAKKERCVVRVYS
jgi:RNA-binding protein YlmH